MIVIVSIVIIVIMNIDVSISIVISVSIINIIIIIILFKDLYLYILTSLLRGARGSTDRAVERQIDMLVLVLSVLVGNLYNQTKSTG